MNYDIYWTKAAFAHFNQFWLRAADPERVMDAYDDLTRLLAESPGEQGESRSSPSIRLWYHAPFELYFRIDEERREVVVIEMRWIGD
jgi:hypothetical protein